MVAKVSLITLLVFLNTLIIPVYLLVHGVRRLYHAFREAVADWQDTNNRIRRRILYGRDKSN